jgi:hypothetical protein
MVMRSSSCAVPTQELIAIPDDALSGGLDAYAQNNGGEIPATSFHMHDLDPYEFLMAITHVFELRWVESVLD